KKVVPEGTIIVTPGIRLEADTTDDHKRHSEPAMAIRNGADYLVVGRPIIHAPDPTQAARNYIDAIEQGLKDLVGT
ncbi:MAG: orotidine 5'-phosphate decarboxylase / HUMPS family protein, partial [bacterium]